MRDRRCGGSRRAGFSRRVFVDDVDVELLEERGIAVCEANLNVVGVVDVLVHGPRRCVPHVVLLKSDFSGADMRGAAALDAKVHLR